MEEVHKKKTDQVSEATDRKLYTTKIPVQEKEASS